jgi:hypothetical protein
MFSKIYMFMKFIFNNFPQKQKRKKQITRNEEVDFESIKKSEFQQKSPWSRVKNVWRKIGNVFWKKQKSCSKNLQIYKHSWSEVGINIARCMEMLTSIIRYWTCWPSSPIWMKTDLKIRLIYVCIDSHIKDHFVL